MTENEEVGCFWGFLHFSSIFKGKLKSSLRDTIVASCVTKKCKNETRYNKENTFGKICRNNK